MHESVKEKISQFVDDELNAQQAMTLLKNAQQDLEIQQTMARYQLISQALKSDRTIAVSSDFASKIHQQLQHEATYLLPPRKKSILAKTHFPTKTAWTAIAASVALFAVLWLTKQHPQFITPNNSLMLAQGSTQPQTIAQQQVAYQAPLPAHLSATRVNRLNEYLLAHGSSVYTTGDARVQPYAAVASYHQ